MGTPEQKKSYRSLISQIVAGVFIAVFTLLLANIDKHMQDFKQEQRELKVELQRQQEKMQELILIDVESMDYALLVLCDGEYTKLKKEKKDELLRKYNFIKGD